MRYVVGLHNNSYKPMTNTAWVRARLCKLQKGCTRFAAANDKVYQLLAHDRWFSLELYHTLWLLYQYNKQNTLVVLNTMNMFNHPLIITVSVPRHYILFLVFKATFNNISAISWQPVLLVEEAGIGIEICFVRRSSFDNCKKCLKIFFSLMCNVLKIVVCPFVPFGHCVVCSSSYIRILIPSGTNSPPAEVAL
jgi:hypothetical protein